MSTYNNMTNIRSSSQELDGRRPTAGGMPSYQEGRHYHGSREFTYESCSEKAWKYYSKFTLWPAAKWREVYFTLCDLYHCSCDAERVVVQELMFAAQDRERRFESVTDARDRLQRELGPREFTLTYSPAWYADDKLAQDAMRVAIDKLTRYYKHDIIEFHAVGEYTEAGRSHVHCYYELDGGNKITDKNFKRAWSHWNPRKKLGQGHQGGHHANVRTKSDFLGYIEKDLDTAWMNVYITKNANDNTEQERSGSPSELSSAGGSQNGETS